MSMILAMSAFALSMSISPGSVNLITLSSGIQHGFRKTLAFVSGASGGFTLLLLAIGLGLGQVAQEMPQVLSVLGWLGCLYIAYMGIGLYKDADALNVSQSEKRPKFWQGAALQWLNPKAWMACLAGVSGFGLSESTARLALFVCLYGVICYLSIACWAILGVKIAHLFEDKYWRILFNRIMGGGLVAIAAYLLVSQYSIFN